MTLNSENEKRKENFKEMCGLLQSNKYGSLFKTA